MVLAPDWNLLLVHAAAALRRLPTRDGGVDWGDLRVAHLDTGCTRHPVFGDWAGARQWLRPDAGLNLLEPDRPPFDPLDYRGNPGHGTRTCSILCGVAPASMSPTPVGVAPRLPVVPYRVVKSVVLLRTALAAIRHAVDTARC